MLFIFALLIISMTRMLTANVSWTTRDIPFLNIAHAASQCLSILCLFKLCAQIYIQIAKNSNYDVDDVILSSSCLMRLCVFFAILDQWMFAM